MNAQPTPGPWFSSALRTHGTDPSKDGCDIGAQSGANVAIALHQADDRSEGETIANARMVAAAPDLLEALQAAAAYFWNADREPGGLKESDVEELVRAAVAKATAA